MRDDGRRGRPRDDTRDEVIQRAVLELLAKSGYGALTVEAVAARAQAGKGTIYRRWPGKAQLVVTAVTGLGDHGPVRPDTGELREDLVTLLCGLAGMLRGTPGAAVASVIGELATNAELAAAFRDGLWRQVGEAVAEVVDRGVQRGEVAVDAPRALVCELAGAALAHRLVVTGQPLDDEFAHRLADDALLPLLRPKTATGVGSVGSGAGAGCC